MRLKEKERPRGLLVWLALQVAFIYTYIYMYTHRWTILIGSSRLYHEKYPDKTYIPTFRLNKKRIIFVGQVFFIYTLGSEGATTLTPTLVFNKPKTRIVKLNLNCIIIHKSLSLFLSFRSFLVFIRFDSPESFLPSIIPSFFVSTSRRTSCIANLSPSRRVPKRKRKLDYKLARDTSTHRASSLPLPPSQRNSLLKPALFGQK